MQKPIPFSSDTEFILETFSDSSKIIECLPKITRHRNTKKFLGSVYNDIEESCGIISSSKKKQGKGFYNTKAYPIRSESSIPKPKRLSMSSIPSSIHRYIKDNSRYVFHFSNRVGSRTINVYFVTTHTESASHVDTYVQYFERMMVWFNIAFKYSSDACGANIGIYIYDTPLLKSLPVHHSDIVDIVHVNTAYTYACPMSPRSIRTTRSGANTRESEVIIYRREEWFKVFIHETFHMMGLDFSGMPNLDRARGVIYDTFPLQSSMDIFESYTETWSTIMNACFCSYFCLDDINKASFVNYVEVLLGFESAWRIFQMHKILRFMGLKYSDLHLKTKKATLARDNLYRENTNIFSYYVLTALLLVNYGNFLEWCSNNNGIGGTMSFHKTESNTILFAKMITDMHIDPTTISNIREIGMKKCFNRILGANGLPNDSNWISETMRMTVCEMC
jgi:hypothetical protein